MAQRMRDWMPLPLKLVAAFACSSMLTLVANCRAPPAAPACRQVTNAPQGVWVVVHLYKDR